MTVSKGQKNMVVGCATELLGMAILFLMKYIPLSALTSTILISTGFGILLIGFIQHRVGEEFKVRRRQ